MSFAAKGRKAFQNHPSMGLVMRLLVVEDNALLSELLAKGLRTAGYEVDLLVTATEASATNWPR